MIFWFDFYLFLTKIYLILMQLIEISWNFIFWKLVRTLILKHFEIRWNKWCPNQVLRKLVKHHNSQNVNSKELLYLQRAPFGVFFLYFLTKLVQMWLQPDKTSCLKTLINTILSTFQITRKFVLLFLFILLRDQKQHKLSALYYKNIN